jgi:uncharacterized iron-regulated protein
MPRHRGATRRARAALLVAMFMGWVGFLANAPKSTAETPCMTLLMLEFRLAGASFHPAASTDCMSSLLEKQIGGTLAGGGIVFLGEVHDNAVHHQLRAKLMSFVRRYGPKTGLVFEHIRADQAGTLVPPPESLDALFAALDWDKSGWPDKAMFEPLFQQVLGRAVYAGEPARGTVRDVARQGLKALPDVDVARLKLDVPLPEAQQDALLTELEASHCGLMPKAAFGTMANAQRYRDAFLADAAMTAATTHGSAIVFTGNGHARRDRGAPFALKQRGFDKPVLVVLFTESPPTTVDPAVADMIVSTPPAVRKDPCEEMRARFGKKG